VTRDTNGKAGLSAGAIARELETTPAAVKQALTTMKITADFVKAGCAYYYSERLPSIRQTLH
jgi:hypothetical protein